MRSKPASNFAEREVLFEIRASGPAHRAGELGVDDERFEPVGERGIVVGVDEVAADPVGDHGRQRPPIRRDHRKSGGHRFEHDRAPRFGLVVAGEAEDVGIAELLPHLVADDLPDQVDPILDAVSAGERASTPGSVVSVGGAPTKRISNCPAARGEQPGGAHEMVRALRGIEVADEQDHRNRVRAGADSGAIDLRRE